MSYLWQEFNIKTFPAETLVFRNGVFYDDLSDYQNAHFDKDTNTIFIDKTPKLPIHIIYIGEIAGNIDLNININSDDTNVIMTLKTTCKNPAFLNIFIKNAGKNSVFNSKNIIKNENSLKIDVSGQHLCENTGIFVKNRIAAYKNSQNILNGYAIIEKGIKECENDISFSVMADKDAKITMKPTQYINSIPKKASHAASLYKPNDNQIYYLRTSGLSSDEIKKVMEEAFFEE